MKRLAIGLAAFWLCTGSAFAALAPNGDTVWTLATDRLGAAIETTPGGISSITLTDLVSGGSISSFGMVGVLGPGSYAAQFTFDPLAYYGFLGLPFRPDVTTQTDVAINLTDDEDLAFAGLPFGSPPPVNPPALALFESAKVSFPSYSCGGHDLENCLPIRVVQDIRTLPEPDPVWLLLAAPGLLVALAGARMKRKRAPEA